MEQKMTNYLKILNEGASSLWVKQVVESKLNLSQPTLTRKATDEKANKRLSIYINKAVAANKSKGL